MTPGMTIALTIHTFVVKVIFLLFNTLSRFVIAFLLRSKRLLISGLHPTYGELITFILVVCRTIGESDGTPLQYSCLENPMDGGAWLTAVHGVA